MGFECLGLFEFPAIPNFGDLSSSIEGTISQITGNTGMKYAMETKYCKRSDSGRDDWNYARHIWNHIGVKDIKPTYWQDV